MISILLCAMFLAVGILSVVTIIDAWRRNSGVFPSLLAALRGCPSTREIRHVMITTQIRPIGNPGHRCDTPFRFTPRHRVLRAA